MNIGVCVKMTANADARIKINGDATGVDMAGIKVVVSDYDEFAVEEAIKTKEKHGGEVVSFTVGDKSNDKLVRSGALALGVDRSIVISDDAAKAAGALGVAKVLTAALQKNLEGCDILFTGKASIDDGSAQVGAMMAELLGWAQVTKVLALEIDGTTFKATRQMDAGVRQVVTGNLPVVITCEDGLNTPRYAKLPNIMKAKRKPLAQIGVADLGLDAAGVAPKASTASYELPPTRPAGRIIEGDAATAAKELVRLLRDEAKVL